MLPDNTKVWATSGPATLKVTTVSETDTPHSYLLDTFTGAIQYNWFHLRVAPKQFSTLSDIKTQHLAKKIMTQMQTGTVIKLPAKYCDSLD